MPVTIKQGLMKYKNGTGTYVGINTISDQSTEDQLAAIVAKGEEVLESLPSTYTELASAVNTVQAAVATKITNPSGAAAGKFLQIDANGDPAWGDAASPTAVAEAAAAWLEDNVAGGSTIAVDSSLLVSGAAADSKIVGDEVRGLKSAFSNTIKKQIAFIQTANSTTSNYYKTFTMLSAEKCYLLRLTVETAGTYTLRIGTGQSSSSMVDTVGTATVQANVPYDFIGYVPSLSTFTTSRLSVSTAHTIEIYEVVNANDLLEKIQTNRGNIIDLADTTEKCRNEQIIAQEQSITFLQNVVDTTATYYKTMDGTNTGKIYAFRVSITGDSGMYTLKVGTGQSSDAMVDTIGSQYITAETSVLFYGYKPSAENMTTLRLEPATPWSAEVYEVPNLGMNVPAYYKAHIENKEKSINAIRDSSGMHGDCFIFITDYHRQVNTKHSAALIKHLIDHTGIRFVVFGGDTQDYEKTFGKAMGETSGFYADYAAVMDRLYSVRGNHEYNYHYVRDEGYPESIMLTYEQIYRTENKKNEADYVSISPLGDFAIDNKVQKIRYYFIGCDQSVEIENPTRKWLFDDFGEIPDGYNIVVFSHKSFDVSGDNLVLAPRMQSIVNAMNAVNTKGSFSYSPDGVLTTYNYSNVNAKALCIIGGHTHYDADSTEEIVQGYTDNILITATTTDAYARQNSGRFMHNVLTREIGTITEQAFDVVNLDIENMKLYMTRIGAGTDRVYDLLPS